MYQVIQKINNNNFQPNRDYSSTMNKTNSNTDIIPHHAQRLYIKLYCERKGNKNKATIQEAKTSWNSLSRPIKRYFYKTSANRNFLKHAPSLSNIEIFLKGKGSKKFEDTLNGFENSDHELDSHATVSSINENILTEYEPQQLSTEKEFVDDEKNEDAPVSEIANDTQIINDTDQDTDVETLRERIPSPNINNRLSEFLERLNDTDDIEEECTVHLGGPRPEAVPEPVPPSVKIGKDLYEMVKGPDGTDWTDISKKEKNHYNSAVRALKREYIKSYVKYLESLSQQQLFDHYVKTLHSNKY